MKKTTFILLTNFLLLLIISCSPQQLPDENQLIEIDTEFSDYSAKNGAREAFLHYASNKAVMLRDNSMPIKGLKELEEAFGTNNNLNSSLTWSPLFASIAKSGEIGYTYGTYKASTQQPDSTIITEGCYVTIWKKDSSGNWKWVLDTGTTGLKKD